MTFLEKLGATADEVAESLRKIKCGGTPGYAAGCPVANYLTRLGCQNTLVWPRCASYFVEGKHCRVAVPQPVEDFIKRFDDFDPRYVDLAGWKIQA